MVLSKGLIISLSFSALSCTLLFLYFRNKMTTVERKVNVMFDLVQNYQPTQEYSSQSNQSYEPVNEDTEHSQDNQNTENTESWRLNTQDDRIIISDDSDDDDSDEVSDSDSDDESEEIPKLSLAKTDNISLTENDIKKISVKETPLIDNTIELEEIDSLDEIDDDDEDDDDNNSEIETPNQNIKKISVTKNDTEENIDNENDNNDNEQDEDNEKDEKDEDNDEVDYTQLKVSELKAIAEAKGLTNYKSLKKTPLIDLIKSAE